MMYGDAIAAAIVEEMQRDPDVMFYGQNMAMTERDPMLKKFGKNRVRLAPISETAETGIGVGAAMTGLRPIVELWMSEFMLVAMDQVLNEAPRFHYMSGGQVKVPVVFKAGYGFAAGWAGQHSNCLYHTMMGIAGLKVVVPSTPADAKGLLTSAIRDDNPVVYLHHYMLTLDKGEVPDGNYAIPLGVAEVKRARKRHHDCGYGMDGEEISGRRGAPVQRRHQCGSHRSAHSGAARCWDHPQVGQEDGTSRAGRPGHASRLGRGHHRR